MQTNPESMQITRTFDLLHKGGDVYGTRPVLAYKHNGSWKTFTLAEYAENATLLSYAFFEMGLERGDKVATISNNRPEWNFVDMGLSQAGMVHVPIYPTISQDEYRHILRHSDAKIVFVSDKMLYEKLQPIVNEIDSIKNMYVFSTTNTNGYPNWNELRELGMSVGNKYADKLKQISASITPDELVSIIYTSGTTGLSKGVMLTHSNFMSNVTVCLRRYPLLAGDIALSFLPLCHVFERMVNYYYQSKGITIYYAESMATIGDNIKELKPHIFVAVPRVIEKVYDKIIAKGKDLTGIKKQLFFWAVNLGYRYKENNLGRPLYNLQLKIARKLIFSKWNEALGGQLKLVISGGAALQPRLARVFWAAGIPLYEGYGLTETSPVIASNHTAEPNALMFGSVGTVLENINVKIADDGEILMKGPSLMKGYYKDTEQTTQVIDAEGWFHTGDIGHLEKDRFLVITDRKKEIFKMSSGKYVAPQVIENKMKESFFIEQCMIVGENEKFVSALVSPNFSFLHDWCARHKIHFENNKELIEIPQVIARYQKEINAINAQIGGYEQIKRFRLVAEQWSSQTGELSPTLKLKRKVIYERYESVLMEIYGHAKTHEVKGAK